MRITILYFAAIRDLVGRAEESVELQGVETVDALARWLEREREPLRGRLGHVRLAVNEEFADPSRVLREGDVVALIPPVAGGSDRVAIRSEPLSIDAVRAHVEHPGAGAITIFVGAVRDHNEGREVVTLEYSAYESMALAEMARIADEIEAEIGGVRLCAHHRVGELRVGEAAVVCAASAPHRDEAARACRALIDRIKERVPIWKREKGPHGEWWVGWEDARCPPGHHH